jgi:hypothetical protein
MFSFLYFAIFRQIFNRLKLPKAWRKKMKKRSLLLTFPFPWSFQLQQRVHEIQFHEQNILSLFFQYYQSTFLKKGNPFLGCDVKGKRMTIFGHNRDFIDFPTSVMLYHCLDAFAIMYELMKADLISLASSPLFPLDPVYWLTHFYPEKSGEDYSPEEQRVLLEHLNPDSQRDLGIWFTPSSSLTPEETRLDHWHSLSVAALNKILVQTRADDLRRAYQGKTVAQQLAKMPLGSDQQVRLLYWLEVNPMVDPQDLLHTGYLQNDRTRATVLNILKNNPLPEFIPFLKKLKRYPGVKKAIQQIQLSLQAHLGGLSESLADSKGDLSPG